MYTTSTVPDCMGIQYALEKKKRNRLVTQRARRKFNLRATLLFFWQDFIFHFGSGKYEYFKRTRHHINVDNAVTSDFFRTGATNLHSAAAYSAFVCVTLNRLSWAGCCDFRIKQLLSVSKIYYLLVNHVFIT